MEPNAGRPRVSPGVLGVESSGPQAGQGDRMAAIFGYTRSRIPGTPGVSGKFYTAVSADSRMTTARPGPDPLSRRLGRLLQSRAHPHRSDRPDPDGRSCQQRPWESQPERVAASRGPGDRGGLVGRLVPEKDPRHDHGVIGVPDDEPDALTPGPHPVALEGHEVGHARGGPRIGPQEFQPLLDPLSVLCVEAADVVLRLVGDNDLVRFATRATGRSRRVR